ncbi:hypothetical protein D9M72_594170 [compost metagenome]
MAQDIGARRTLADDVDIGFVQNLVVVLERVLLVLQKGDEFGELGCKRRVGALDAGRAVNVAEVLRADRIQLFLGRAAA